ncbi:pyrimidine 5'-nucleotidase [Polymorphobacter fuscus]|uniref:Pyrimidine 5'-nucleotidase n=1 Tax=Sandarakinorhabdus fusca TaxID=1439888 RepID=A0A7C9GP55_9SPHN|nr:pyrimidine 5'-nucleotidase [Polymorphobacter fuscus]KAB7647532.1 pyrimidine 5'-nucleotidase [Polymorphobacter fuscus]MQT16793.1 pyrimidine 5'-nucleotidase [Polymorphobacter fuscus]NJC09219.1 putative hydrolase of the HAD superfamily [Polymorphobacter fuscus]
MLAHIDAWIFDLDNTLYPASAQLFAQIDARMGAFIQRRLGINADEAFRVQKGFFHSHGMTLPGLMAHHGVDPREFLADVHDVDVDVVAPHPELAALIARLPGRKFVFTNADAPYATRVLARLGLSESFDALHDIHALDYVPKPQPSAYAGMCAAHDIDPTHAVFVEDMARNLIPAKAIGMTTVWIDNGSEQGPDERRDHIDYTITDVASWLTGVVAALETK